MHTNIEAILGQNLFNRISYIFLSHKIVLLGIYNYFIIILVPMHHYYLKAILAYVSFDYPRHVWFDRYHLLCYLVIMHRLSRSWRSTKEINNSIHLLCQLLITMVSVRNQRIEHCAYLLCQHVNYFVVTLVNLLYYRLKRITG